MVYIKAILGRQLILGDDASDWEYSTMINGLTDLEVLELAHNIWEQYAPNKQPSLSICEKAINKPLPSKADIVLAKEGQLNLNNQLDNAEGIKEV